MSVVFGEPSVAIARGFVGLAGCLRFIFAEEPMDEKYNSRCSSTLSFGEQAVVKSRAMYRCGRIPAVPIGQETHRAKRLHCRSTNKRTYLSSLVYVPSVSTGASATGVSFCLFCSCLPVLACFVCRLSRCPNPLISHKARCDNQRAPSPPTPQMAVVPDRLTLT